MSHQKTLEGTPNVTFLPVSASGATLLGLPDGPMTGLSGQEVAPASPLALQAQAQALPTNATFGPLGLTSSASAVLQSSLVNKLKPQLSTVGLTLFRLTWSAKTTPAGRSVSLLQALARHTAASGCGSLPTPSGTNGRGKNHTVGRLDEWGGSSNPFRGTPLGPVRCVSFELWMMGLPTAWRQSMPPATLSFLKSRKRS
jgi:hypothetical protein